MTTSSSQPHTAVMLMAYGTPRHRDEIEPYYTDIRRGRPPTPEALADLVARYEAIGGLSPLAALTERQQQQLQHELDELDPGGFRVELGLKHADPKIEASVEKLAQEGVTKITGLVLAPHYSSYSIGQYLDRTRTTADPHGISVSGVESWATEPAFVEFIARDLAQRLEQMNGNAHVVFTAHSLPERIISAGDPYPDELRATAEAVATIVGLEEGHRWSIGWQSAGRTPEPWIGPDILDVIDDLGARGEHSGVIVSAVGFVADHLEVLYDLDIEARARAEGVGLAFDRTACVNDDSEVLKALAHRVIAAG